MLKAPSARLLAAVGGREAWDALHENRQKSLLWEPVWQVERRYARATNRGRRFHSQPIHPDVRHRILRRARSCSYCARPATCVDHVVPVARGGSSTEGNLAAACAPCNNAKRDWLLIEWKVRRGGAA